MKIGIKKIFVVGLLVAALIAIPVVAYADGQGIPQRDKGLFADSVLLDGKIITVDSADSIAEAVAIKDGKIVAVGSDKEIKPFIGGSTQVIDLNGATVTPGLIDSHIHFSMTSQLYRLDLSYPNVLSIVDIVEKVAEQVDFVGPGEWVQGRGWNEGALVENRVIVAADLDPVSPDNPVWLSHTMSHYGTANSYALELAGIDETTPDPPGGTIDRIPGTPGYGTPTGLLREAAMGLVSGLIPGFTHEQQVEGLKAMVRAFNAEGMTGAKDGGGGLSKWTQFQEVLADDELTVRVFFMWRSGKTIEGAEELIDRVAPFTKPYISTGDDLLISGGIKHFLDGSGGARTAWVWDEWNLNYTDIDEGNYGYPVIDVDIFREQIEMYQDAGLHISVHAIGDRAIDWVTDCYRGALEENPIYGLRHGIIHCNIPTDWAIDRFAELQATYDACYPEAQSVFMWWIGDTYAGNFGEERCLRLMPFNTYLGKGIQWGGGSDWSVDPYPARYGIWASIARETLLGVYGWNPYGMDESISVQDALRSYTMWAAHQMFMEDKIGSIEVGKYADLAVWDKDMYTIPTDEIKDLDCLMTLLEGEIVYCDPDSPVSVTTGVAALVAR